MKKKFPHQNEDQEMLQAHKNVRSDYLNSDPWRVLRIQSEFVD